MVVFPKQICKRFLPDEGESRLVDHRDRRSPTTELKNLKVTFVVMKKILESQSCEAKLQQNVSERHRKFTNVSER